MFERRRRGPGAAPRAAFRPAGADPPDGSARARPGRPESSRTTGGPPAGSDARSERGVDERSALHSGPDRSDGRRAIGIRAGLRRLSRDRRPALCRPSRVHEVLGCLSTMPGWLVPAIGERLDATTDDHVLNGLCQVLADWRPTAKASVPQLPRGIRAEGLPAFRGTRCGRSPTVTQVTSTRATAGPAEPGAPGRPTCRLPPLGGPGTPDEGVSTGAARPFPGECLQAPLLPAVLSRLCPALSGPCHLEVQ